MAQKNPKTNLYPLSRCPFFRLRSLDKLAELLRVRKTQLRPGSDLFSRYRRSSILKPNGTARNTETPIGLLRATHERVLQLFSKVQVPSYLHSGIKGKSYVTNAKEHVGHRQAFTLDLKSFFENTSWFHVYSFFYGQLECAKDISGAMASLLTVDGHLPTGSPMSTLMSYFIHKNLFDKLDSMARNHNVKMTLFLDDLTFSGQNVTAAFRRRVRREISKYGLTSHKDKVFNRRNAREVTGVIAGVDAIHLPWRRHKKAWQTGVELWSELDAERRIELFQKLMSHLSEGAQIENHIGQRKARLKAAYTRILPGNSS